jgi:hypothetical protein
MNRPAAIVYMLTVFFGILLSPANAQISLKTGYNISFLSDPGLDRILSIHNGLEAYSSPFHKLRWLHGFEAGFRFKTNAHGLELTYQNGYQRLRAEGEANGGNESFTDKIRFSIQSAAVGYQVSSERFGIGVDLQRQWYRTKVELNQAGEIFKNTQAMMALKGYFMIIFPGSSGSDMALQPYLLLPFKAYDSNQVKDFLFDEAATETQKWNRFGLTVLFYNGGK